MKKLVYMLLLSLGSGNAFAQATASGTIQGTVTDKSGAVVSGARSWRKAKLQIALEQQPPVIPVTTVSNCCPWVFTR